jgi:hypothetical protein
MGESWRSAGIKLGLLVVVGGFCYVVFFQRKLTDMLMQGWLGVPVAFFVGGVLLWLSWILSNADASSCSACNGTGKGNSVRFDNAGNATYFCEKCGGGGGHTAGGGLGCFIPAGLGFLAIMWGLYRVGALWNGQ